MTDLVPSRSRNNENPGGETVRTRVVLDTSVLIGDPSCLAGSPMFIGCDVVVPFTVIEELDGTKSYWALAHPPGKPDFHHPDCFALTLAAPGAA